jgi:protein SCO1
MRHYKVNKLIPALILLILLISAVFIAQWQLNKTNIPELYKVPEFEFTSQLGDAFSNKDFENKISVANFIFTNCPGICPIMGRKMAALYEEFSDEPNIQFISFSVDPDRDSLQALVEYAQRWDVNDNRWLFLRTEKGAIDSLYENGFKLGGELPRGHSGAFVLIDQKGFIRGYYKYDDEESIDALRNHMMMLVDEL